MAVNDRRIILILAAQPIRPIRCILRCIRKMLFCKENSFNSLNSWFKKNEKVELDNM